MGWRELVGLSNLGSRESKEALERLMGTWPQGDPYGDAREAAGWQGGAAGLGDSIPLSSTGVQGITRWLFLGGFITLTLVLGTRGCTLRPPVLARGGTTPPACIGAFQSPIRTPIRSPCHRC